MIIYVYWELRTILDWATNTDMIYVLSKFPLRNKNFSKRSLMISHILKQMKTTIHLFFVVHAL